MEVRHHCDCRGEIMGAARDGIEIVTGDITRLSVDVIVNAANERMLGGGGVDGAIHAVAGKELLAACRDVAELRAGVRCPTGEARLTPAFRLPAKWVVHTVGPIWHGGGRGEPELLASCYRQSLQLALGQGAQSIAFPAISTGVYSYPPSLASTIAVRQCDGFLADNPSFEKILLVAFRQQAADILRQALGALGTKQ